MALIFLGGGECGRSCCRLHEGSLHVDDSLAFASADDSNAKDGLMSRRPSKSSTIPSSSTIRKSSSIPSGNSIVSENAMSPRAHSVLAKTPSSLWLVILVGAWSMVGLMVISNWRDKISTQVTLNEKIVKRPKSFIAENCSEGILLDV